MSEKKNTPKKINVPEVADSDLPPDMDAEEVFNAFWKKNGNQIFSAIAVAALIVVGSQVYNFIKKSRFEAKQVAFTASVEKGDVSSFIGEYSEDTLAGLANLDLADEAYKKADYDSAKNYFSAAKSTLISSAFYERALLGEAISSLMLDSEVAVGSLESIVANGAFTDVTRSEAGYSLAVYYWEKEDFESMKLSLEAIQALSQPGYYGMKASRLLSRVQEENS